MMVEVMCKVRNLGGRSLKKTRCSDGYDSDGKHEMRSDRDRERVRQENDRVEWVG